MVKLEMRIRHDFEGAVIDHRVIGELKKVLLETMFAVERHAKRFAPVKTGRLRSSIHVDLPTPATKIVVADGVDYGVHQEFGTSSMPAHPFMRPARDVALKVDLPVILKKHKLR